MELHGILMQIHGIPWNSMEFPRVLLQFHRNTWTYIEFHGIPSNPMQVHGFLCNFQISNFKLHGTPLELHENPPKSMEIQVNPWNYMDICEILWISPEIHGIPGNYNRNPWNSVKFHGIPWKSMGWRRIPWNSVAFHRSPWNSMELHGNPWI